MPRKGPAPIRLPVPDPIFGSRLASRFIGQLLHGGKRSAAERILYHALENVAARTNKDPLVVLEQALSRVMPTLEVRPRRVGGATYQVPVEVREARRLSLGLHWLIQSARARSGRSMEEKLAGEIVDAAAGQGASVKKREDTHKMAEANRAFAHYRW